MIWLLIGWTVRGNVYCAVCFISVGMILYRKGLTNLSTCCSMSLSTRYRQYDKWIYKHDVHYVFVNKKNSKEETTYARNETR